MNANHKLAKLVWWPAVFAGLSILTRDGKLAAAFVLALVFHRDISAVLRRRRVSIQGGGLRCDLAEIEAREKER